MLSYPHSPPGLLRRSLLGIGLAAIFSLPHTPARAADLNVSFLLLSQTAQAGGVTLSYSAAFQNTTGSDLLVSSASFDSFSAGFDASGSYGFFNGNGTGTGEFIVRAGGTVTMNDVVALVLDPSLTPGAYDGLVTFIGESPVGTPSLTLNDPTVIEAVVAPAAVPEPGGVAFLVVALVTGVGFARKRRK